MKKPLYLMYITGLGDSNPKGQRWAVSTWHWWGAPGELFQMNWADKEPWQPKFERLLARTDELLEQHGDVALVAVSAGAAAALNVFAARKDQLLGVVVIVAKVNRPEAIGQSFRQKTRLF